MLEIPFPDSLRELWPRSEVSVYPQGIAAVSRTISLSLTAMAGA